MQRLIFRLDRARADSAFDLFGRAVKTGLRTRSGEIGAVDNHRVETLEIGLDGIDGFVPHAPVRIGLSHNRPDDARHRSDFHLPLEALFFACRIHKGKTAAGTRRLAIQALGIQSELGFQASQ